VTVPQPRSAADDRTTDCITERIMAVGRAHPSTAVRRGNALLVAAYRDPFVQKFTPHVALFLRGAHRVSRAMQQQPDPDRYAVLLLDVGHRVRAARETASLSQPALERVSAGWRRGRSCGSSAGNSQG
jgi:hypothetical protein